MAHLTLAVSEATFRQSFKLLKENLTIETSDSVDEGAFTAGYDIKAHFEHGSIDLRDDNTVHLSELDLVWDRLHFSLGVNIDEICVGGGCADLGIFGRACLPEVCVFSGNPDVKISPDLAPITPTQEVSFTGSLTIHDQQPSLPLPLLDFDLCKQLRIVEPPDDPAWRVFIDPQTVDIDLFDFPDTVEDKIFEPLEDAIKDLLPDSKARDLVLSIIGSVSDLIRDVLNIPDQIDEWLTDLFNTSFGLLDFIAQVFLGYFATCNPIYTVDKRFTILPASNGLVPVKIPIADLSVETNDKEMILRGKIGA